MVSSVLEQEQHRSTDCSNKTQDYRFCQRASESSSVRVGVSLSQGEGADDRVGVTVCDQANRMGEGELPLCRIATNKTNKNTVTPLGRS